MAADDDGVDTDDDSDYNEPELRYGAQKAFAAMKAKKMGLDACYRKIVSLRNASQLHGFGKQNSIEMTSNEFWACSLDMQVLHSLDPQLRAHYMKGKNILGWIIKVVMCQFSVKIDYSWVDQALEMSSLSVSGKDGHYNSTELEEVCNTRNICCCEKEVITDSR